MGSSNLVVRIDPVPHMLGFLAAYERGYFRDVGIDLTLYVLTSKERDLAGDPYVQLSDGTLDVTATGVTTMHLEAARDGKDFKTVATRGELVESGSGWVLLARRDLYDSGEVRATTDLTGRTVGVPGRKEGRSYPHILLVEDLKHQQMRVDDLSSVFVAGPWALSEALANKRVDATWMQPGWSDQAVDSGLAIELKRDWDVTHRSVPLGVISYSGNVIREKRDQGVAFMKCYLQGLKLLRDPDPTEMGKLASKYFGLSADVVARIPGTDHWPYVPLDGRLNLAGLEKFQEDNYEQGLLKGEPEPVERWVDLSFTNEVSYPDP